MSMQIALPPTQPGWVLGAPNASSACGFSLALMGSCPSKTFLWSTHCTEGAPWGDSPDKNRVCSVQYPASSYPHTPLPMSSECLALV